MSWRVNEWFGLLILLASSVPLEGTNCSAHPFQCGVDVEGCIHEHAGRLGKPLPIGRGLDLATNSGLYTTRKPPVFALSYCEANISHPANVINGFQLPCEAGFDNLNPGESTHESQFDSTELQSLGKFIAVSAGVTISETESLFAFQGSTSGHTASLREAGGTVAIYDRQVNRGRVTLEAIDCIPFSENFLRYFQELNETDANHSSYRTLFTEFGTHVITQVTLGGRQISSLFYNYCKSQSTSTRTSEVKAGLSDIIHLNLAQTVQTANMDTLAESVVSTTIMGGNASLYLDDQMNDYAMSATKRQAAFAFSTIVPLYQLVNNNINGEDWRDRILLQNTFKEATDLYMESRKLPARSFDSSRCNSLV